MSTASDTSEKKEDLLRTWHKGLRILQIGNFTASTYYGKLGKRFGFFVVIATSAVSSTVFATIGSSQNTQIQFAAGVISLVATVLSALQTFLGYAERASSHKEAAVGYGELRTEVQVLLASDLPKVADLETRIESIRSRWSALDKGSPTLPDRIYADAAKAAAQSKGP